MKYATEQTNTLISGLNTGSTHIFSADSVKLNLKNNLNEGKMEDRWTEQTAWLYMKVQLTPNFPTGSF